MLRARKTFSSDALPTHSRAIAQAIRCIHEPSRRNSYSCDLTLSIYISRAYYRRQRLLFNLSLHLNALELIEIAYHRFGFLGLLESFILLRFACILAGNCEETELASRNLLTHLPFRLAWGAVEAAPACSFFPCCQCTGYGMISFFVLSSGTAAICLASSAVQAARTSDTCASGLIFFQTSMYRVWKDLYV